MYCLSRNANPKITNFFSVVTIEKVILIRIMLISDFQEIAIYVILPNT